jgi:hypothetical protein
MDISINEEISRWKVEKVLEIQHRIQFIVLIAPKSTTNPEENKINLFFSRLEIEPQQKYPK